MKRDLDLVRKILLQMEAAEHGFFKGPLTIADHSDEEIGYHVFLMSQAGLVKALPDSEINSQSPHATPINITWAGHEFLEASKDDGLWNKAKTHVLKPAGGAAFDVLLEWLKSEAKQRLGLS